ncbi:sialate O-acetylesterase [uncultured Bacteroides sp.]|uniref:sialate O-acetylesterase n=1 Tax=uncultured Bacteroides sp. TaxID=162156 RepID=UPI00262E4B39|nr:sialate O-acetylesterase [uncultured Bacteroides sp.]
MKRLIYFFFAVAMMLPAAGCNDDPDFIKNAPPSSGETDGTDDDSDAGGDGTVEGVDPNFQIYLCFGQSNMEGFAQGDYNGIEDIDKTVNERFQVLNVVSGNWNGVQREAGHWYTAVPPLCRSNTGLCPADYFGRTMVEELSKTNPDIKVGVIVVAIGGAGIKAFHKTKYNEYYTGTDDWQRSLMDIYDGYPYRTLVDMARIAQKQGVIKGILMHQGESDAYQDYWEDTVSEIYNALILDLGLKVEEVPLLVGEMCREKKGVNLNNPDGPIQNLKNYISNCYVISSENCPGYEDPTDDWHFSSEGYRELGRHYAQTMLDILANQKPEDPNASIPVNNSLFDFSKFTSDLSGGGNGTWNADNKELQTIENGVGGWSFTPAIDMTAYKYLVVEFEEAPTTDTRLAMYSSAYSVFEDSYTQYYSSDKRIVFDIQKEDGYTTSKYDGTTGTLDLTSIKLLGIQTNGGHVVKIKDIYVTNELKEPDPAEPTPVEGLFKFEEGLFNPKLSGVATFDFTSKTLSGACAWGVSGWEYNPAINIKNNEYLVAKLSGIDDSGTKPYLILGNSDVMGEAYQASGVTKASDGFWYSVVKLSQDLVSNVNVKVGTIYLDRITLIGIQTPGSNEVSYKIEDVYISPTNPLEQ